MTTATKKAPGGSRGPGRNHYPGRNGMSTTQATAPLARSTDPAASHDAAAALNPSRTEQQRRAILHLLEQHGPMTDRQLTDHYVSGRSRHGWPALQNDSVRKRRAELKNAGLVREAGRAADFGSRVALTVWEVVK